MSNLSVAQVSDFTGGINFRADQFKLAPNESPGMLNVEIDPRGGIFSRAGYESFTSAKVPFTTNWTPKGLYPFLGDSLYLMLSTGFANSTNGEIFISNGGNFTILESASTVPVPVKSANGASFATWENVLYITVGVGNASYKYVSGNTYASSLTPSGPTWQPYSQPTGGYMPKAELTVTHANKLFVANTNEDGTAYPNRLRWSHEGSPEDWYQDDYIDIEAGGQGITGIQIVDGQLLVFKPKAIYLLMGYDADSFQLVELTTQLGIQYPQQAVSTGIGVYFFDFPKGLFYYSRNSITDLFERIRPIIINRDVNANAASSMTCSWINQRLWLSMPYNNTSANPSKSTVNFIFDPTIGKEGAYTMFQSSTGYGLLKGTDFRDSSGNPIHLMVAEDDALVYSVDNYNNTLDDVWVNDATPYIGTVGKYKSYYTTGWFDDNRYMQLKTFISPYLVLQEVDAKTEIKIEVYKDFNESLLTIGTQTFVMEPTLTGGTFGTSTYGNSVYGERIIGSTLKTCGLDSMGQASSIQLKFQGPIGTELNPGRKWGLNSITYRYKRKKIRGN